MKIKELEGRIISIAGFEGDDPFIQLDDGKVLYLDEHDSFERTRITEEYVVLKDLIKEVQ